MVVMVMVVGTAVIVVMVLLIIEFTCSSKKVEKLKMVNKTSCNLTNLVYLLE